MADDQTPSKYVSNVLVPALLPVVVVPAIGVFSDATTEDWIFLGVFMVVGLAVEFLGFMWKWARDNRNHCLRHHTTYVSGVWPIGLSVLTKEPMDITLMLARVPEADLPAIRARRWIYHHDGSVYRNPQFVGSGFGEWSPVGDVLLRQLPQPKAQPSTPNPLFSIRPSSMIFDDFRKFRTE
jgi:hypothetical protein